MGERHSTIWQSDEGYPVHLRKTRTAPEALYLKGMLNLDAWHLAVVGSRDVTDQKLGELGLFLEDLYQVMQQTGLEWVITSGLAHGVDQYALMKALEFGLGGTVVLPCAINKQYPTDDRTRDLILALSDSDEPGNAVVSQFPFENFDQPDFEKTARSRALSRNGTTTGLSHAVLVGPINPRTKGTIKTAYTALQQRRPVFLIEELVPPQVLQELVKVGAVAITQPTQLLKALGF